MNLSREAISAIIYVTGAIFTVLVMIAGHRPQLWKVRLRPDNHVHPGEDLLVPVGDDSNSRRMRVMQLIDSNTCLAIDIRDQQHHNAMALGVSAAWPILMPFIIAHGVLHAVSKKQTTAAMVHPRPRKEVAEDEVPAIMKGHAWKH